MPFCEAASNGTLIGFEGGSYEFSLDVRIICDADGLGDRVRFNWIGGQGGNTPEIHTSAKIPQMVLSDNTPFWFGVHIRRFGTETDCDIDFDIYYSDLVNPIQKVYSETAVPMTTLWHFSRHITYGFDLNCRIQLGEGSTINGADETVYAQRIGVEWGELSAARVTELADALETNYADYVDPNTNCGETNLIVSPPVTYPVQANTDLTFTVNVNADATPPVQYQWYQDGIVMSGEVGPTMVLTLRPEDSNTSISVLVQNPCSTQLSDAYLIGEVTPTPFCKVYECDAFDTAVLALSPLSYSITDEAFGAGSIVDLTGNDRAPTTFTMGNEAGFLEGAGVDPCTQSNAALANLNQNVRYITGPNGSSALTDDPVFYNAMDDISTHATVAYTKLQTEYGSWTIFSQYITDDPIRFNMEIIINNSVDGYKIGVRSYNQHTFTVTTQWSPLIPQLTKAQDEVFNLGFHIDRSNPGASTPFEFWLRVYVDFQLVYENEFTNGPPNILDPAYTNDIDSVGLRWCYTNPDYSGFSCLVHRWFYKAGAFTTGELASLSNAWEQNKSTYVDPDPNCTPLP
jgi:hypothetical protein